MIPIWLLIIWCGPTLFPILWRFSFFLDDDCLFARCPCEDALAVQPTLNLSLVVDDLSVQLVVLVIIRCSPLRLLGQIGG